GSVCTEKRFPSAIWDRRGRHVLRLGSNPGHAFGFSPDNQSGYTLGTSIEITCLSLVHGIRIAGLVWHCTKHFLGKRTGIYSSHIFAVISCNVLDISCSPTQIVTHVSRHLPQHIFDWVNGF